MGVETLADFVLRLKRHQVSVAVRNGDLAVSCPAGRMSEYLLAEIRARKSELLGFLNGFGVELRMAIDAVGAQPDYEVSPAQRRIWMFDQLDLSRRAYNVPGAYLLTGKLDLAALQESLNVLVARHEILRTTFINRDSEIRQRIHDEIEFTIPMVEVSATGQSRQTVAELIRETVETRFDLAALPLFDLRLIRLGERSTLVVFNLHHIICDGRSLAILTDELFSRYLRRDAGSTLAPMPRRQYKDYAAWFNRLLESGALNYQRDYWLRKLGGEAPPLRLPYDHHRPARLSRRSRIKTIELSHEEVVRLRDLAVASRCTLFNALLTFVLLLLRSITDNEDIRIGTPVIGRPHPELRDQIGCHINLVVLRNRIEGGVSLETLMAAVQAVTAEAFAHQLYPFELLASELAERRTPNRNPLFDVLVALQDDRHEHNELSGLALKPYPIRGDVGRYDLTFGFEGLDSRLRLHIEYLEELFTEATAERIGKLFLKLVRSGLDSPHAKVADLAGDAAPYAPTAESVTSREPVEAPMRTGVPVSEVPNLLLEVLRDVLRAPGLDVVDNYFEHGGDSVKAMQTIARLSRSGMALAISDFFVYPTIGELSSRVRPVRRGASAGHHARTTQIGESTLEKVLNEYPSWRGRVQGVAFLSPMQEGILFQTISGGEPSTCQAQTTLTLEGRISPSIFSTVWEHLFERHDMLRTRIVPALADRPLQVTLSPSSAGEDVRYRDLRDLPVDEQERALALATLDDRQSGFTLGDAPLVRVYLFQLRETRFQVLISHQQIVLDGWSVSALLIEFAQIYDALASSRPVRLPAVSSFSSYVDWLATNTTETQRQYWQEYLADLRAPTDLPFKNARSGASIGKVHLDLGPHLSAQLASLSRERMVTLSTILQALWGVLVGKYNETDDVVFGTVISVRPAELDGIEYALGVYMNSIPVRLRSFANQTFTELLDTVREQSLQSWPHGHFPLAEILKSTPHRDRLFAHLLIMQNYPLSGDFAAEKHGFEAELIDVVESAGYDLVVEARPGRTVRIAFEYNQGAYERRDVEALAGHFLALARSAAAQPGRRIAGLSLLDDEAERRLRERVKKDQTAFSRIGSFDFD